MTDFVPAEWMQETVASANAAMNEIELQAKEITEPHDLALLLADLADLKRSVSEAYKKVEQQYVASAGTRKAEVPGLGLVEIKKQVRYSKWDTDALWNRVAALALDERKIDLETGELLEREAETVARVLRDCATPSWKVTGLRAHGIQVDEYAQVEPEGWSVRLPRREGGW